MTADPKAPRTVIVHHRSGIGDLVWHVPYFRAVAATSRDGKATVIARPSCCASDILSAEPSIEAVIEFDRRPRPGERRRGRHDGWRAQWRFAAELRGRGFERAVIFSGRMRYGLIAWLAGIRQRAGFGFTAGERLFLNQPPFIEPHRGPGNWVYPEATAFAIAHGFVAEPQLPRLYVPEALREAISERLQALPRPRYALAIGASEPRKRWPIAHFAELARGLAERGCGVVLLGGAAEADDAEAILRAVPTGLRSAVNVLTEHSVLCSAAALAVSDFCVGNDTGMLNVAAAVECASLGLFGATRPLTHDPQLHAIEGESMDLIESGHVLARLALLGAPGFAGPPMPTPPSEDRP
ncbi:MAG: glycosyltransferase family 9 protein [Rhodocyclaceae bacterium]|nr:glycosyltransferase family 9 protein [Rhodocyclaceae bacterium]